MPLRLAVMTEPHLGGTYEQLLAAARLTEDAGLATFARSDHYLSGRMPTPAATDAFATMAALARDTRGLGLTILVTPVTFRHPAVIAKQAATIDELSDGRFSLGVGTGWSEPEHTAYGLPFPDWAERFERLEETLGYLKAAFGKTAGGFAGRYYSLADIEVRPQPSSIPIIVGGSGPHRTPDLAGRFADEYNHFQVPLSELRPKVDRVRAAALAAGRNPHAISVSMIGFAVTAPTEAGYRQRLAAEAVARDVSPDEREQQLRDQGVPHGPGPQAREMLAAMEEGGVDTFYLVHLDLSDLTELEVTLEALA